MRQIDIYNGCPGRVVFNPARLRAFVRALDALLPRGLRAPEGSLSIAILDDESIAKVHGDFLNKPSPTDVITFVGDGVDAGEICVGAQTAVRESSRFGFTPDRELCLYVAHGYLHLAGVDDVSAEDAAKMRAAEAEALGVLDKKFRRPIFTFYGE